MYMLSAERLFLAVHSHSCGFFAFASPFFPLGLTPLLFYPPTVIIHHDEVLALLPSGSLLY